MSESFRFFDEVQRVGDIIFEAVGRTPTIDKDKLYLKHIAKIYRLLVEIHDLVAEVATRVSLAADMNEARKALEGITYGSLEKTFWTRDWCDELERLGKALHPLSQDPRLLTEDQRIWDEFCTALEHREGEVAKLYDIKLMEFQMLGDEPSLESLQVKVKGIYRQLAEQKALFDLLALKAEGKLHRLRS